MICSFSQCYNESLEVMDRWFKNIRKVCDLVAVYNDGSDKECSDFLEKNSDIYIRGEINDWKNELLHKQQLMDKCLAEHPEIKFFLWLDFDEIPSHPLIDNFKFVLDKIEFMQYDGVYLRNINLWKSTEFERMDNAFGDGWFVRIWRNNGKLKFGQPGQLHQPQYPINIYNLSKMIFPVINFGFSKYELIKQKYEKYKAGGQSGWALERISPDVGNEVLVPVDKDVFP